MRFIRTLAACLLLGSGLACGGGDLGLPADLSPADIKVVTGNGQVGEVGAELSSPLVVLVVDGVGQPVPNVSVAFKLGAGAAGGSTAPDTALTDADGEASSTWVLGGTEGRQTVDAEVVGEDLVATFSAQAERTSALRLELVSGDEQSGESESELPDPLVVRLVDDAGDPVAGRAVAWVVAIGGGTAAPETSNSDAEGLASTRWTLGSEPGTNRINAVVSGVGVVSFTATAVGGGTGPSPDLSGVSASPEEIEAGTGQATITVTVRDGRGDPIEGATVTLSASGGGNSLGQPSQPTGADGVTTGTLSSIVPGTKDVTAVVNGSVTITQAAEVRVTAAPAEPDHLVFLVQPSDTEDDEILSPPIEVGIVDEDGDLVPLSGIEIEIEFIRDNGDDHRFDGDPTRTTVAGVAVFPDLSMDHHHDDFRLRAFAPDRPELGAVLSDFFDVED